MSNNQLKIVGCAILDNNGLIICLPKPHRHHHILNKSGNLAGQPQGFITSSGCFTNREEAKIIAKEAGQIIRESGGAGNPKLYSEDLW